MQPVLSNVRILIELHCNIMLLSFPTKLVIGSSTIVDAFSLSTLYKIRAGNGRHDGRLYMPITYFAFWD